MDITVINEIREGLGDNLLVAKRMYILLYVNEDIYTSKINNIWAKVEDFNK